MKIGDAKKIQALGQVIQMQLIEEGILQPCSICGNTMKVKSRPDGLLYWRSGNFPPCKGTGIMSESVKARIAELAVANEWDGALNLLFSL